MRNLVLTVLLLGPVQGPIVNHQNIVRADGRLQLIDPTITTTLDEILQNETVLSELTLALEARR